MQSSIRYLRAVRKATKPAGVACLPIVQWLLDFQARMMALEKPGQTLQATAPVHEARPRRVEAEIARHWESRRHGFSAVARAIRRVAAEDARRKRSSS